MFDILVCLLVNIIGENVIIASEKNIFSLTNKYYSYVFCVGGNGMLEHIYYGAPLTDPINSFSHHYKTHRDGVLHFQGKKNYNLSEIPQEYPTFGSTDFRFPAFHCKNKDGNTISVLKYKEHFIYNDKKLLNGLPSARGGKCNTLIVRLEDNLHKIEVDLAYTIYENHGVLVRSSKIKNHGNKKLELRNIYSSSIDFPASQYKILHLHGSWSREFSEETMSVPMGRFVIDSNRGSSSAAHSPFIALCEDQCNEVSGNVYSSSLIYSGNHSISVEKGEFNNIRLLTGINPFNFNWSLSPGESFQSPEAVHAFSKNGLRGMSHIWHSFIREKIAPINFKNKPRPTYINTWESSYFKVNQEEVLNLADKAVSIGLEMVVLDDGWFEGRNDDSSSLGDWYADSNRFPDGIQDLAIKIKNKGLKFGIWVEPEMINTRSELYKKNPDWVLMAPGRISSLGRNQLILDYCNEDVVNYIFDKIDKLLSGGNIDYIKWDMNRNMSEVGSPKVAKQKQLEVPHRYILGLYSILSRLTKKYPNVLFENCASGGNRLDLGMLSYMSQSWPSDMSDPIGRLKIINGCSYLFPLDVLSAYIGPSPNHQNGRITSVSSRFNAGAFCAAQGVSLNYSDIDKNKGELTDLVNFAKEHSSDMIGGNFYRLKKSDNVFCWQYITKDYEKVFLLYFHILSGPNKPFEHIKLVGLEKNSDYLQVCNDKLYSGNLLMENGFTLPYVSMTDDNNKVSYMPKGDFSSKLFVFQKI